MDTIARSLITIQKLDKHLRYGSRDIKIRSQNQDYLIYNLLVSMVYKAFDDYIMPQKPTDFTFKQIIDKMIQILGSKKSVFSLLFECLNLTKNSEDDYYTIHIRWYSG